MRSYTINTDPVHIKVNGLDFALLKTDAETQAEILQYLAQAAAMNIASLDDVRNVLRTGTELIDGILGGGACYRIFGDTPISLSHIAALLTQICKDCTEHYRQYLKNEYLEG